MLKAALYNSNGENAGDIELPVDIFGIEPNEAVVHQYVKAYLANQRQGSAKVKTRSEVSGGGRKPWRQKGTGRARVGTIRSPLWRHGGVIFGPSPRSYRSRLPKKMKRLALLSVLSDRASEEKIDIIESPKIDKPSTREVKSLINKVETGDDKKILMVTAKSDKNIYLSARNIKGLEISHMGELNTYQILKADRVIFTSDALNLMKELWTS
ncbi:MAG: 50S ribosomal protein L4 [Candidatus Zixiibacteriota bacterium]